MNFTLLLSLGLLVPFTIASTPCQSDDDCAVAVGFGATCLVNHVCSNPSASGCLGALLPNSTRTFPKRVCNSDDPPKALEEGICREPPFEDWTEIRICSQNWDSVTFEYWILQIVLSEILGVPTSIEHGMPGLKSNFYDASSGFEFGEAYDWEALKRPSSLPNGDCRLLSSKPENYKSCAHFLGQGWDGGEAAMAELLQDGYIDPLYSLGMVGRNGWYVPKYTVQKDPSLMNYLGLQGDQNRHKVAKTFLTPTTWNEYCTLLSNSSCTLPDGIAQRAPTDAEEGSHYFVEGLYRGHFRMADSNNCTLHPTNCTGHFVGHPCYWENFVLQQLHHLDIPLQVDHKATTHKDYSTHMLEIIQAGVETQSNFIMQWWTPEQTHQKYMGTDAELQRVTLPPPTQECHHHRADFVGDVRCTMDPQDLIGEEEGSCDQDALNIRKIIVAALHHDPDTVEALRSPSYEVLQRFRLTSSQFGQMFAYQQEKRTAREAICQWVVDNLNAVEEFIPENYPRSLQDSLQENDPLFIISTSVAVLACLTVLVTSLLVQKLRDERPIRHAQIGFLRLLLGGAFLVSLGAIAAAMPPNDAVCLLDIWLIQIGYTLELVPLIVKIAAINTLLQAAKKMKKIQLKRQNLFGGVLAIMMLVVTYLVVWTILDPPRKQTSYQLSDTMNEEGEYMVVANHYCGSETYLWWTVSVAWNVLLLFGAAVLAFQTRTSQLSESQTLAMLIYSHLGFLVSRLVTLFVPLFLSEEVDQVVLTRCRSILHSLDTIGAMAIYFGPKLFDKQLRLSNSSAISRASAWSSAEFPTSQYNNPMACSASNHHDPSTSCFDGFSSGLLSLQSDTKAPEGKPVPDERFTLMSSSKTTVCQYRIASGMDLGISIATSETEEDAVLIEKVHPLCPLYGVAKPGDEIVEFDGALNGKEMRERLGALSAIGCQSEPASEPKELLITISSTDLE